MSLCISVLGSRSGCWPHLERSWAFIHSEPVPLKFSAEELSPPMEPTAPLNPVLVILLPPTAVCCEHDESKMRFFFSKKLNNYYLCVVHQNTRHIWGLRDLWHCILYNYFLPKPTYGLYSVEGLPGGFIIFFFCMFCSLFVGHLGWLSGLPPYSAQRSLLTVSIFEKLYKIQRIKLGWLYARQLC